MRYLFITLLTLVAYSSGAVCSARLRRRVASPQLFDNFFFIIAASLAMFVLHGGAPLRILIPPWLVVIVTSGFLVERLSRIPIINSEFTSIRYSESVQSSSATLRAWRQWRSFASESADYQARILIALLYFIFLWPLRFFARSNDFPQFNADATTSSWTPRPAPAETLEDAQRQF